MNQFRLSLLRPDSVNSRDNMIGFALNLLRLAKGELSTNQPEMELSATILYYNAKILADHLTEEADGQ